MLSSKDNTALIPLVWNHLLRLILRIKNLQKDEERFEETEKKKVSICHSLTQSSGEFPERTTILFRVHMDSQYCSVKNTLCTLSGSKSRLCQSRFSSSVRRLWEAPLKSNCRHNGIVSREWSASCREPEVMVRRRHRRRIKLEIWNDREEAAVQRFTPWVKNLSCDKI